MSRPATRDQLQAIKRQVSTISYGKQLLERKRDALVRAMEEDRRHLKDLERVFREIADRLSLSYALIRLYEGQQAVWSMRPTQGTFEVDVKYHSLMGCRYSSFTPHGDEASSRMADMSYDPALVSLYMDDLVRALGECHKVLWEYVNLKAKISALEKEVRKTLLKINTLEHNLLPDLNSDLSRIREVLSERERQERFRVKKVKSKTGKMDWLSSASGGSGIDGTS
jgi:V/A-type H+-transporting ATPase subunit D